MTSATDTDHARAAATVSSVTAQQWGALRDLQHRHPDWRLGFDPRSGLWTATRGLYDRFTCVDEIALSDAVAAADGHPLPTSRWDHSHTETVGNDDPTPSQRWHPPRSAPSGSSGTATAAAQCREAAQQ